MRFKKWTFFFLFSLGVGIAHSEEILRDVVRFKDGTVVRGFVVEQVPESHLKVKTKDGLKEFKMADVESLARETIKVEGQKSPALSCLASLIAGLGQHINGDHAKGFIIEGVVVGGWLLTLTNRNGSSGAGGAGAVAYYGAMLYGLIDAPISAADINGNREKALYAEAFGVLSEKLVWGITPGYLEPVSGILPGASINLSF